MAKGIVLSNDAVGISDKLVEERAFIVGEVTADVTHPLFAATTSGKISYIYGGVLENGSDGSNPLTMTYTVLKNGTTVSTTDAAIAKTAASDSRASTVAAGTGITQAVLKTDGTASFSAGDVFAVTFDITRTASPTTEITSPFCQVGVVYNATAHSGLPDASTGAAGNV